MPLSHYSLNLRQRIWCTNAHLFCVLLQLLDGPRTHAQLGYYAAMGSMPLVGIDSLAPFLRPFGHSTVHTEHLLHFVSCSVIRNSPQHQPDFVSAFQTPFHHFKHIQCIILNLSKDKNQSFNMFSYNFFTSCHFKALNSISLLKNTHFLFKCFLINFKPSYISNMSMQTYSNVRIIILPCPYLFLLI